MGIGEAVERGAEAAGFVRRAGTAGLLWALVILFSAGSAMFITDRITSASQSDRYVTRVDFESFKRQSADAQGAYQARVDALFRQVTENTKDIAVQAKGSEAILKSLDDLKAMLRQR